ncbi:MAG TPA: DNA translocase FtsK [Verrucomicrobiota bacterium]|nr:DNA translocase FtsK [Verrucomicrobiota bacterium]
MSRKGSSDSANGFGDIIGVVLLAAALLLLVSQLSFDRCDIASLCNPPNKPIHNWIGPFGAYFAWWIFTVFGLSSYLLPVLLAAFGVAYLFGWLDYLRQRQLWSGISAAVLVISLTGILHILTTKGWFTDSISKVGAVSAGGFLGYVTYGQSEHYEWGLSLAGPLGAAIVYATACLVSLLILTNFRLGDWLRAFVFSRAGKPQLSGEEEVLERRARELERRKKELEKEVEREADEPAGASGLGADLKPVPEPTVRDLSVPQVKPGPARARKTTLPEKLKGTEKRTEPMFEENEVIPANEVVAAATTADILGDAADKVSNPVEKTAEPQAVNAVVDAAGDKSDAVEKPDDAKAEPEKKSDPVVTITGLTPPRPRPKKKPLTVAHVPIIGNYQLPPMEFLQHPDMTVKPTETKEELMANAQLMKNTLAQFDIEVSLGDITKGPTITRYELHPAPGVKLEKIQALSNNLAAALKAERIHILAPVPGKSSVGIEVPNPIKTKVIMRDLFESEEWRNTKARLPVALGKDVYGHPIIGDLTEMPHLLIAGSTGSGKSVCINSIIASLLYRFTPDQLRFVMIDPKVVELQQYNVLPHLVVPVVTDPKKVILALRWVVNEMEKRYQIFARVGVRNIGSFNGRPKNKPLPEREPELPLTAKKEKVEPGAEGFAVEVDEEIVVPREEDIVIPEKLSYIVVIIDELADLMLVAPADVEMAIARITQMARAAGIHCIVATQRPSVDVITGVIKANIPARIAFQVASRVDSRTILDAMGADKLLGKGDMLFLPPGSAKLIRAQGALVTDHEIQSVVDFIAGQAKPSYEMEIHQQLSKPAASYGDESGIDEDEDLIQQCIEVIRSEQKASVSLLQRRLRLGYTREARIMDELENRGIVGPSKGAEPRDILIDLDAGQPQTAPE